MMKLEAGAWLPDDVMYLIMSKLMVLPTNLARFSAVCKWWYRLVSDALPKLIHEHRTTPIALVPVVAEEGKVVIYNLMGGEYITSLPRGFTRIIGSSFGWLILTNVTNSSVSLFNPLSKSHFRLPPVFPEDRRYLVKGVLSKPPEQHDAHFDIAVIIGAGYLKTCKTAAKIAFLHVENYTAGEFESMRWVYSHNSSVILDVNSIGGRICVLYTDGNISCCKCSTNYFSDYYCVRQDWPSRCLDIGDHLSTTVYLLESSSSDPIVVFRYKDHRFSGWPTVGFKILTFISGNDNDDEMNKTWNWTEDRVNSGQRLNLLKWTEIETVDNDVIFLSDKASLCTKDAYKLQGSNSIYFSDEYEYDPQEIDPVIFNVDQNCVTHFWNRPGDTEFHHKPPIWFQVQSYDEILKFSSTRMFSGYFAPRA